MEELMVIIESVLPVIKGLAWIYVAFKIAIALITVIFTIWIFSFVIKRLKGRF